MRRTAVLVTIAAAAGLLGSVQTAAADVRVSPNYRIGSDSSPFRGNDVVGLAVSPTNSQRVVQINANYLDLRCEATVSDDGGTTWSTAVALTYPAPGAGQSPFFPGCGFHGSIKWGSGQNVYAVGTALRTLPSLPDTAVIVWRSADGGVTWGAGVVAMAEGAGTSDSNLRSQGPSYTRPSISVVPAGSPGAPAGSDRVYAVARETAGAGNAAGGCVPASSTPGPAVSCPNPTRVATSADNGATFSAPVNASALGLDTTDPPPSVANTDGSITVAWRTFARIGELQSTRSTDLGATWSTPVKMADVQNYGLPSVTSHVQPTPPAVSNNATASYVRLVADPASPGRIYATWTDSPSAPVDFPAADHFINPNAQVYFSRSTNFGASWSAPKLISDNLSLPGARTHQTRHPNVSVSPTGRVNIVWHDARHWFQGPGQRNCNHSHIFCEDIRLGDTYLSYSTDGGLNFSPNIRVNDRSINRDVGWDTRPTGYWAFGPQSVTVAGDRLLVGWMDSREGNWDTDTEDIYLAKVDFAAGGVAPVSAIDAPDAVARSIAMSKAAYIAGSEGALVGGPRDPANATYIPPPLPASQAPPTGPASRNASAVVIVNENDVAGAMAATVLARANPGPVLLAPASGLSPAVRAEVARMRPANAFIIGDTTSLSAQVVTDLMSAGLLAPQITRLGGGSSAATAAAIAARLDYRTTAENTANLTAFNSIVIANPSRPESAAAVTLAAARRLPFLYTNSDGSLPAETTTALAGLDIDKTLVIGGTASVSAATATALTTAGAIPTRLGGADQYATSDAVLDESKIRGLPTNVVYVADGDQPMDAALLSGVAARATGVLVLAPGPLYSTATTQATGYGITTAEVSRYIIAGPAAAPPPPPPPPPVEPPPPPVAPPPPPVAPGDTTAPVFTLSGALRQKLAKTVTVRVRCTSEACTATVAGSIKVPKVGAFKAKTYKLVSVKSKLTKNITKKFSLKISASARAAIKRALRKRKRVSAALTVTAADAAGNKGSKKRSVRFKL